MDELLPIRRDEKAKVVVVAPSPSAPTPVTTIPSLRKLSLLGSPITCLSLQSPQVCLFGQGPYLEQVQVVTKGDNNNNNNNSKSDDDYDKINHNNNITNAPPTNESHGWSQHQSSWRLLVFKEGGTIHGIRFLQKDYVAVFGGKQFSILKRNTSSKATIAKSSGCPFQIVKVTTKDPSSTDVNDITSSVTLLDWIWDVQLLMLPSTIPIQNKTSCDAESDGDVISQSVVVPPALEQSCSTTTTIPLVVAVGLAHNEVEIYRFIQHKLHVVNNGDSDSILLQMVRLRRIVGNTRCVTYSLSFANNWQVGQCQSTTTTKEYKHQLQSNNFQTSAGAAMSSLVVAAGTASHEIVIWTALDHYESRNLLLDTTSTGNESFNDGTTPIVHQTSASHVLRGHEGVIHAVQFHGVDRSMLASASDDRSVRLWKRSNVDDDVDIWTMAWVGWGHSARVWRVQFCPRLHVLLSTAEDGTARVWSLETGACQVAELHVANCQSLWSVDVHNSLAIFGGNDGTVALVDLRMYRLLGDSQNFSTFDTCNVPDDQCASMVHTDGLDHPSHGTKPTKKAKKAVQVVFGMQFYPLSGKRNDKISLVLATRGGSLMTLNLADGDWTVHEPWYQSSMYQSHGIDPSHGCCLCVHTSLPLVAIGTTRGDIVLNQFEVGLGGDTNHAILSAQHYKSVQSVQWGADFLLLSFHVQGMILLWYLTELKSSPSLARSTEGVVTRVLDMGTKAVPLSFAFNASMMALAIGDTRGSIALFQGDFVNCSVVSPEGIMKPSSVVNRVHRKEHVTSILFQRNNRIVSVGNDGCMVEIAVDNQGIIHKLMSVPVVGLTGIKQIWALRNAYGRQCLVVGGYYGNRFVAMDTTSGYELFRADTGGRQRSHDCFVVPDPDMNILPFSYCLAVLVTQSVGGNKVIVHQKPKMSDCQFPVLNYVTSRGLHSETIFDVCLLSRSLRTFFLLSGSEDCQSILSLFENGQRKTSKRLMPQESCVRCVSCSHQLGERMALLAVGGGKLTTQFFSVQLGESSDLDDPVVRFLGQGRAKNTATIDHRINAIKCFPLHLNQADSSHVGVTGDSDGNVYSYVVDANESQQSSFLGHLVCALSRPVLSLEVAILPFCRILAVGTTSGDVHLFSFGEDCEDGVQYTELAKYKAHQMGTNCITSWMTKPSENEVTLLVCTGGDDQAIAVCCALFALDAKGGVSLKDLRLRITREASASAIKGVTLTRSSRLVSVGYSQRLSLWDVSAQTLELNLLQRVMVDVGDVNSMGHCRAHDSKTGMEQDMIAVCGAGVELFVADVDGDLTKAIPTTRT